MFEVDFAVDSGVDSIVAIFPPADPDKPIRELEIPVEWSVETSADDDWPGSGLQEHE